ncbi:cobalamin biosynthesis protein CbiL [Megalodesulfovibrio paquesii]
MGRLCLMVLMLTLCAPVPAWAHRVNVFAWVQQGEVVVEGGFARGNPARGAAVEAFIPGQDTPVFRGNTDDEGLLRFALPEAAMGHGLRIVLSAGEGHRNEWLLAAEELAGQAVSASAPATDPAAAPASGPAASDVPAQSAVLPATGLPTGLAEAQLEQMIAEAVRREVSPLQRQIAELQRELLQPGPSVQDITAGIGFLFGLAGVAMLVKRRR